VSSLWRRHRRRLEVEIVLGIFLSMSVLVGVITMRFHRRAATSEEARDVIAEEQAALRRVATLVARQPSPGEVFAAVTEAVGRLLQVDAAAMLVNDANGAGTVVGVWFGTSRMGARPRSRPRVSRSTQQLPRRSISRSSSAAASGAR
jgi:hypothetical protein